MGKKGKFVPVSTLGDLTDLLNHNCRALEKRLTKLARRNRGVAVPELRIRTVLLAVAS